MSNEKPGLPLDVEMGPLRVDVTCISHGLRRAGDVYARFFGAAGAFSRLVTSPVSLGTLTDEVRVWVVPLDPSAEADEGLLSFLTADERARADRYRVTKARSQFVTGRGWLRQILGTSLAMAPVDVPLTYTGAGKPYLLDVTPTLHFNVTHTDGLVVIALSPRPVGVDVEQIRSVANADGLVGRFFSPAEQLIYRSLPAEHQSAGFFRGWTCKEALIKAAGLSVAYLDGFDVELDPRRPAALVAARHPTLASTEWSLAAWTPESGYAAALAVETTRPLLLELGR